MTANLRLIALVAATSVALGGALAPVAFAQKESPKKLYCWNEGGQRICSDALPASAVDRQRTEINSRSGMTMKRVARELTAEERAQLDAAAKAAAIDAEQLRREMAVAQTYDTEADLERSFRSRFEVLDEGLKTGNLARRNLQQSLLVLLRQANELELQSKPIGKRLREQIQAQHTDLRTLVATQKRQQEERVALDAEFRQALTRYRELKQLQSGGAATSSTAPGTTAVPGATTPPAAPPAPAQTR